jgi:hypothetical protein
MIKINNINVIDPITKEIIHTYKHEPSIQHFTKKNVKKGYFSKIGSFFSSVRKYFTDFSLNK